MTRQRPDPDRVLEDWLAEGPSRLPDRIVQATVDQLDDIRQRRSWWPPGSERMTRIIAPIAGAAAVLIVAVLAVTSYFGRSNVGAPTGTPFTSDRYAYTVVLPDGWTRDERPGTWADVGAFFDANSGAGVDYFEDLDPGGEVAMFAYVSRQPIPAGMSFDAWAALIDSATAAAEPCFERQGAFESATVDGETGRVGTFTCPDFQGGFDVSGPWTTVQVLIPHGGRGYAIYFWPGPGPGSQVPLATLRVQVADWLARWSFTN